MSLEGLHVENFIKGGFTSNHSTSIILPISSTAVILNDGSLNDIAGDGAYLNPLVLPQAVRMKISVQNSSLQVGQNGDWGFWSVCIDDISISGFDGIKTRFWAEDTYPVTVSQYNPLKNTEYEPDFGNGGTNISTLQAEPYDVPGDYWPSSQQAGAITENVYDGYGQLTGSININGKVKRPYKMFTENNTLENGDQNINDYITEYGASFNTDIETGDWNYIGDLIPSSNAEVLTWQSDFVQVQTDEGLFGYQLLEQIEGSFYSPTTGRTYVDPSQAANKMWHPAVRKVLMFDTLGQQDNSGYLPGAGIQNNEIDVFIIFKDLQQLQSTSTGLGSGNAFNSRNLHPSNGFFDPQRGITILETFDNYDGSPVGLVNVDFDGVPKWNRVATHPPNNDDETTGVNDDGILSGEGVSGTNVGVTVETGGEEDEGTGDGTTTTTSAPNTGTFSNATGGPAGPVSDEYGGESEDAFSALSVLLGLGGSN